MKSVRNNGATAWRPKAVLLAIVAIAIAWLGYGWHRTVLAQSGVTIIEYQLSSRPFGIARRTSDHSMWFTEPATGKIGRSTQDGTITEYALPGAAATSQPTSLVFFGSEDLWFTEYGANKIGRINPVSGVVSGSPIVLGTNYFEYSVPTPNSHPFGITTGIGSQIFFTEETGNSLGYIVISATSVSPTVTEFPVPTASSGLQESSLPLSIRMAESISRKQVGTKLVSSR
jgi:streptogramin lyase